jgi:4-amino-4-deoxy-L-arabinose transferase-like glycosyltransferase
MKRINTSLFICLVALAFWSTAGLLSWIAPWWDEGWTMNTARNWVVDGHYGQYQLGEPVGPDLSAAWPVVSLVAIFFKLLGIGIWQARLAGILATWMLFALLYWIGKRIAGKKIAETACVVLLALTPFQSSPAYNGVQTLGEIPALLFFSLGLIGLTFALDSIFPTSLANRKAQSMGLSLFTGIFFLGVAALLLAVSMNTKAQMPPFVLSALGAMILSALLRREWRAVLIISATIGLSWLLRDLISWLFYNFFADSSLSRAPVENLMQITGLVFNRNSRLIAGLFGFLFGGLALLGLFAEAVNFPRSLKNADLPLSTILLRSGLLGFSLSWFGWYLLLGNYFIRYMVPAVTMSALFTAEMLYSFTDGFNFRSVVKHSADLLLLRNAGIRNWQALIVIVVLTVSLAVQSLQLGKFLSAISSSDLQQVVTWLNTHTSSDAVIESYDSELFFLLERNYHYPDPSLSVSLTRARFMGESVTIDYDVLLADPDYLVIGSFGNEWGLYEAAYQSGLFAPIVYFSNYTVLERVR